MGMIYLDNAATTKMDPYVMEAMSPYLVEQYGNPASLHNMGRGAKIGVENARNIISRFINATPDEIIFTGSGSEGNNTVIKGISQIVAKINGSNHIITSSIEHHSVLEPLKSLEAEGFRVTYLPVNQDGIVDITELRKEITPKTFLISIMHANNELGSINPMYRIGAIAKEFGILLHVDAVQSFGHIPIDVREMGIDLLSASAHKLHGPKGVGLLFAREGIEFIPLIHGGHQERSRRASTLNVAGIVGFGAATKLAQEEMLVEYKKQIFLRDYFIEELCENIEGITLNGSRLSRLPNNINISIAGVDNERLLMELDLCDVMASSGSACNSSEVTFSHCLQAIGLNKIKSQETIRLTLSKYTTIEEIDQTVLILNELIKTIRS